MAARKSSSTTSCCASCGPGEKGPRLIALYVLTSLLLLVSLLSLFAEIGLGKALPWHALHAHRLSNVFISETMGENRPVYYALPSCCLQHIHMYMYMC